MKKIIIEYSIKVIDGTVISRSYKNETEYVGYFNELICDFNKAIDLFELRQEQYKQKYFKKTILE